MRWKPDFRKTSAHAQALGWGLIGVGAFAPFSLWPLGIICWLGLYLLLRQPGTLRRALGIGFAFGIGQFLGGVSWVYVSMHDVGGMPVPLALLATTLFAAYLALYPMLAAGAFRLMHGGHATLHQTHDTLSRVPRLFTPLIFAASWTIFEVLRGVVFTGFPWLSLGYAESPPSPLAGYAPILGVYGLSFITCWIAGLAGEIWQRARN